MVIAQIWRHSMNRKMLLNRQGCRCGKRNWLNDGSMSRKWLVVIRWMGSHNSWMKVRLWHNYFNSQTKCITNHTNCKSFSNCLVDWYQRFQSHSFEYMDNKKTSRVFFVCLLFCVTFTQWYMDTLCMYYIISAETQCNLSTPDVQIICFPVLNTVPYGHFSLLVNENLYVSQTLS